MHFSNFSTKFTENIANHVAQPQYNCCEPAWNNYSKHAGFVFLVYFLPILSSLYNSIMNIKSLFRWRITFGALWKGNIPFEKGHIRVMKANVTNGVFGLSSHLFKIWTWSSHRMWKTRLQILCIVFEAQFGIVILKITNMCFAFAHQATHLRFSPQLYASIPMRQWVKFPYLGRVAF